MDFWERAHTVMMWVIIIAIIAWLLYAALHG